MSEFTGNEVTYALQQTSDFKVNGIVTIKERRDGNTTVLIELSGTDGDVKLPAHLHLGDISTPGAEVAALLSPVLSQTGISETLISQLDDDTKLTYKDFLKMEANIKIHLSEFGPERDIILAGGNIGTLSTGDFKNGRVGIGVCKSE